MDKVVKINKGQRFSEVSELANAKNVMIAKTITGLGYTYHLLNNKENTEDVICVVPLISIARSKVSEEVFAYVGALHRDAKARRFLLKEYLKDNKIHKIIVTPELLEELIGLLSNDRDYMLAIDEADLSVMHSSFREAMSDVLDIFENWGENRVACSATFVEFSRRSLQLMDRITVVPTFDIKKEMNLLRTNSPETCVEEVIKDALELNKKVMFFLNDSTSIINLVKNLNLSSEDCSVLSGKGVEGKIIETLGTGYSVGDDFNGNLTTPVTFLTTAYISGNDIFDEDVDMYFVVNSFNGVHTLFSKEALIQGAGRLRNGPGSITLIANFNSNLDSKFVSKTTEYKTGVAALDNLNMLANNEFLKITLASQKRAFIKEAGVCIREYKNEVNYEMIDLKFQDSLTVKQYQNQHNFETAVNPSFNLDIYDFKPVKKFNKSWNVLTMFKEMFMEDGVFKVEDSARIVKKLQVEDYANFPQVKDMVVFTLENLDLIEDVLACKSVKGFYNLKEKVETEVKLKGLIRDIKMSFKVGNVYSKAEVKGKLQAVYANVDLKKTAKASDLKAYFITEDASFRVDGKKVAGISIKAVKA